MGAKITKKRKFLEVQALPRRLFGVPSNHYFFKRRFGGLEAPLLTIWEQFFVFFYDFGVYLSWFFKISRVGGMAAATKPE